MPLARPLKEYKRIAEVYQGYNIGRAILELLKEVRQLRKEIRRIERDW